MTTQRSTTDKTEAISAAVALAEFRADIAIQRTPLPRVNSDDSYLVRAEDVAWYTPSGTNPARLGPVLASPMKTFELFLQEFGPGESSDMQQHHHEAVHVVVSGHGHSEIEDAVVAWGPGDFICVPTMHWHRHYNDSADEGVRMLLVENSRLLDSLGLNYRVSAGFVTWDEHRRTLQDDQQRSGRAPMSKGY
ncbi:MULTISPECIES: cupin domain-containing protein [unclassified Gordonia (in: high G+C Gram-positive bacteria)]|uniref:cupin domain-containing protein n=1 Tax=unclassified Gordonia (in: high G+C Gram-positive bacteria) TaxID=2657482 RepID=UPI0009AF194A|nr:MULTISPECIES: cupin domain-containing protein [unclassified Gordonia (in: high G+C Gram-positive bacteria)]MDF3282980.1 cupin domain-containing protein [Gordonia sp. N1V]OPX10769.1 hypothetical protein B1964_23240 [Gordonia sp. i37]